MNSTMDFGLQELVNILEEDAQVIKKVNFKIQNDLEYQDKLCSSLKNYHEYKKEKSSILQRNFASNSNAFNMSTKTCKLMSFVAKDLKNLKVLCQDLNEKYSNFFFKYNFKSIDNLKLSGYVNKLNGIRNIIQVFKEQIGHNKINSQNYLQNINETNILLEQNETNKQNQRIIGEDVSLSINVNATNLKEKNEESALWNNEDINNYEKIIFEKHEKYKYKVVHSEVQGGHEKFLCLLNKYSFEVFQYHKEINEFKQGMLKVENEINTKSSIVSDLQSIEYLADVESQIFKSEQEQKEIESRISKINEEFECINTIIKELFEKIDTLSLKKGIDEELKMLSQKIKLVKCETDDIAHNGIYLKNRVLILQKSMTEKQEKFKELKEINKSLKLLNDSLCSLEDYFCKQESISNKELNLLEDEYKRMESHSNDSEHFLSQLKDEYNKIQAERNTKLKSENVLTVKQFQQNVRKNSLLNNKKYFAKNSYYCESDSSMEENKIYKNQY